MTIEKIYNRFGELFPGMIPQVIRYYGYGRNRIRICLKTGKSLMFRINDDNTYSLTNGE